MNEEINNTLKNADNEATRAPYWLILDPSQNMTRDLHQLASQITGVFFCREDAEHYLKVKKHHYSDRARVFCHSGHHSQKYENLCKDIGAW